MKSLIAFFLIFTSISAFGESRIGTRSASARINVSVTIPAFCRVHVTPLLDSQLPALGIVSVLCNQLSPPQTGLIQLGEEQTQLFHFSNESNCEKTQPSVPVVADLKWKTVYLCPLTKDASLKDPVQVTVVFF